MLINFKQLIRVKESSFLQLLVVRGDELYVCAL